MKISLFPFCGLSLYKVYYARYPVTKFTMLSKDQVRHIAELARLTLSEKEVTKFSGQLTGILDYIDQLKEADVDGVEPTSQVTGLHTVSQGDDEVNCPHSKELLACSNLPKVRGQIRVHSSFT